MSTFDTSLFPRSPSSFDPSCFASSPPPPSSCLSPPPPRTIIINLSQRPIPSHPPSLPSNDSSLSSQGMFISFCCAQDLDDPHPTSYTPLVKPPYTQELYDSHLAHAKWLFGIKEEQEEEEEEEEEREEEMEKEEQQGGMEKEKEKEEVGYGEEKEKKMKTQTEKKKKNHAQHAHTYEEQSPAKKFKELRHLRKEEEQLGTTATETDSMKKDGSEWEKPEKPKRSFSLSADRPGFTEDVMILFGEKSQ